MSDSFLGYGPSRAKVKLSADERRTHMHVIGSSGSGKSRFLEHLMRQDLNERRGFCLIDPHGTLYNRVLAHAAHYVISGDIILLNLSEPSPVIGFNPFLRVATGDVSVQVDRRIQATMHAWNVKDTDQTPTLARTLRLLYTAMIECNINLPQAGHLIDFDAHEFRAALIDQLASSPFVQREWKELQALKSRDWRMEVLSAKNRLCKFLTSDVLCRFLAAPTSPLNLTQAMENGSTILVNLATSDHLSTDNARAFGALLVNEFFECARRRKMEVGKDPTPYRLYLDEFQNFVSLDIAEMLDQVRKFGLFMTLAHQRFGQLDENLVDAVLTNCGIKAVFGGLPVESAKRMAQELFIGKLNAKKVKESIYQTKFWPKYGRDKVYSKGTSRGRSTSTGSSRGEGSSATETYSSGSSSSLVYDQPTNWYATSVPASRTVGESRGVSSVSGSNSSWSESFAETESFSESESVTDVPIFIPVPFEELSSIQYYTIEEQIWELTGALKEQFPRHCFIKVLGNETQPLLVPPVEDYHTSEKNRLWYERWLYKKRRAIAPDTVDRLLGEQEAALLNGSGRIGQELLAIDVEVVPQPQEAPVALESPLDPSKKSRSRRRVTFLDTIQGGEPDANP